MNGNKRVILHLTFDGILFDRVFTTFEQMETYENRYLLGELGNKKPLQYIKNTEKLIRVDTIEEWKKVVSDPQVDIIYLHGLWNDYLKAVDCIGDHVVVMWWCYGMEIYENVLAWPPLLPQKLYKPRTHWYALTHLGNLHNFTAELSYTVPKLYIMMIKIFYFIKGRKGDGLKRILSRIDLISTPLDREFLELKKNNPTIKAKQFKLQRKIKRELLEVHNEAGNILIEHSANLTNNHLDLIAAINKKKISLENRDVFIPLSYGDKKLAKRVKEKSVFIGSKVHCLMESLPFNEYTEMMSGCTHAVFGMLRQSGLGNIHLCFQKGIKVFLFKDSILYKQFKSEGYHVFSIEDDLSNNSISVPLSNGQAVDNYELFYKLNEPVDTFQQQFDNIINNN